MLNRKMSMFKEQFIFTVLLVDFQQRFETEFEEAGRLDIEAGRLPMIKGNFVYLKGNAINKKLLFS